MINRSAMNGLRRKVSEAIWDSVAGALTFPKFRHQHHVHTAQARTRCLSNLYNDKQLSLKQPCYYFSTLASITPTRKFPPSLCFRNNFFLNQSSTGLGTRPIHTTSNIIHTRRSPIPRTSASASITFTSRCSLRPISRGLISTCVRRTIPRPISGIIGGSRPAAVSSVPLHVYKPHIQVVSLSSKSQNTSSGDASNITDDDTSFGGSHKVKNTVEIPKVPKSIEHKNSRLSADPQDPSLLGRIAHIHGPTKDEMLATATGIFQRLRIRMKWTLIRQMRPYNLEDIAAFLQWLLVGHIIWVLVGTTTFFSIVLYLANTVSAQENLASMIGNYLTKETGVRVVFESAIVPRWKDGRISFRKVFASRRPGALKGKTKRNVEKGSSATAAAAAAAAANVEELREANTLKGSHHADDNDTNYTQFDVTIDEVAVTLSFAKWMNGKGLLKDVEVKGVRGVVDRTHVHWDEGVDPRAYRHIHEPGDFEIESFKLEDLLVTVYQPDGFRPFAFSVFSCDLPQLRKQWLFYDFLSANNMSGSYDESLYTIHPRQSHGISPSQQLQFEGQPGQAAWKKMSRLRIDGLPIDHLNSGVQGPFGWIERGNVDIVADIMFPEDHNDLVLGRVVQEIVDRVEKTVQSVPKQNSASTGKHNSAPGSNHNLEDSIAQDRIFNNVISSHHHQPVSNPAIIMDLHIQLNDVRAAVPLFTKDLSYANSALIRPIVAYINSRKTYIPVHCRVIKPANEFDGSWTVYDSGLMDEISAEMYQAFAVQVMDRQARRRRFRKVGLWSLQLFAQAILMAMAGNLA